MFTNSIYISEPSSYDPINFPIETNLHSQFRCKIYLSLEYYKSGLGHLVIPYEYRGRALFLKEEERKLESHLNATLKVLSHKLNIHHQTREHC